MLRRPRRTNFRTAWSVSWAGSRGPGYVSPLSYSPRSRGRRQVARARRRGAADRFEGRDVAGGRQLRPDEDGPDRLLGREVHQEPAGDAHERRGAAPDLAGDGIGLAGPDPGDLPEVAGGRDG